MAHAYLWAPYFFQVFWRENLIHLNRGYSQNEERKLSMRTLKYTFFRQEKLNVWTVLDVDFFSSVQKTRNDICLGFASRHSGSRRWVFSRTRRILGKNALHLLCPSILILSLAGIMLEASELFTTQSARKGE